MGCGASTDRRKLGGRAKKTEDPELNGKVKFLSCPSVGEVKHPDNGNKWFLIVFAPQTHHGMIMAARNMKTGKILCKDVKDPQIVQEKEAQKITMSWNLFFKAIASEVSKTGKSGAKVEFGGEDCLRLEIKIAITGQAANSRKPDLYRCELTALENTPENVFRLFVEPIATFYGKKRTDLLDRPDPQKEKTYGECEANSIVKVASISDSEQIIKGLLPNLQPLRNKMMNSRLEYTAACSQSQLMKAMIKENSTTPTCLQENALPAEQLSNVVFGQGLSQPSTTLAESKFDVDVSSAFDAIQAAVNADAINDKNNTSWYAGNQVLGAVAPVANALNLDEAVAAVDSLENATGGNALAVLGYFCMYRNDLVKNLEGVDDARLRTFLIAVQSGYSKENAFHNANRAAKVLAAWCYLTEKIGFAQRARLGSSEVFAVTVAVLTHDIHHPGVNNQYLKNTASRMNAIYSSESTLERYQAAATITLLQAHLLPVNEHIVTYIAALIISTDFQNHQDLASQFTQRSVEVSDFGRNHQDRVLAASVLLKLSDLHHCALSPAASSEQWAKNSAEFKAQGEIEDKCGINVPLNRKVQSISPQAQKSFVRYVALPIATVATNIYPDLQCFSLGCSANCD